MGEQEVFLGICYSENSKHSMEDVFGVVLIQWCQKPLARNHSILL